jgi:hypothetical protein
MTQRVAKHILTKLIIAAALALSVSALDATSEPPENNKLLNKYKLAVVRKKHNADWLSTKDKQITNPQSYAQKTNRNDSVYGKPRK